MGDNKSKLVVTLGWIGAVLVFIAYAGNTFGFIPSHTFIYQFLNIVGSIFLFIIAFKERAYPNAVLNIVWIVVALFAIASSFVVNSK
ncbi:MAG: hypothetical protein WCK31_03755 [bacterium]